MRDSWRKVSRSEALVCPRCEVSRVTHFSPEAPRCDFCHRTVHEEDFTVLRQIASLVEAPGSHRCECGHPEMRMLPDRVFWCPSFGSVVTPV